MFLDIRVCLVFLLDALKLFQYKGFVPQPPKKNKKRKKK